MTKEEKTICKMYLEDLDKTHDCNEYKLLMQMLEQPTSDDCVSRAELLKLYGNRVFELQKTHQTDKQLGINWCINTLNDLSPVTPTHGICKDCSHYDPLTCNSGTCLNPNMQWSNEVSATHYCADFEKRGNENGEN